MTLNVVFENAKGFVTDFGEEQPLTDPQSGDEITRLPRYGVWQHDSAKRKPQVTFTSNDLDECKKKLE